MLTIKNLKVEIASNATGAAGKKLVLKGLNLTVRPGEIHVIMGPNGAGKTSLAMALAGHPSYKSQTINSKFQLDRVDMRKLKPEERARAGLFVAFQNPVEITGVSVLSFLRTAEKSISPMSASKLSEFKQEVTKALKGVRLDEEFMQRSLNEGFSGGEKKRAEIAQLLILKPKYAILDEIDSGLDVDSLRVVAHAVKNMVEKHKTGIILITHYSRILRFIQPDAVHVLIDGKIKATDGMNLVKKIEERGYAAI